MPAPTSAAELVELIRKSGVVDASRLAAYLRPLGDLAALPGDLKPFANQLIRDGILTYFQAEQFLLGKWKRFTIGKYKVLERLGVGGMGQVFLCEHKHMRRRVAVKVLPTAKADEPAALERFYRESRLVAELDHPNLVRAFDIDQEDTLHFLVMEYVDGLSLQEIVKRTGRMDAVRACHYVAQSADGLQYAYEVKGIVHRDIKPANILVDRTGLVKILDMGLARFFHDEDDVLTKKYDESVLGTADYLAPEQAIDSHSADIRADIYSLGATFYFLLAGQPPFAEGTVAQKLIWHQSRSPKSIRSLRPDIPEGVAAVLERMMMKDKAARYQTPAEVAAALAPYTQAPIAPPSEQELPRLSPAALAAGTGTFAALSGRHTLPGIPLSSRRMTVPHPAVPVIPAPAPVPVAAPPAPVAPPALRKSAIVARRNLGPATRRTGVPEDSNPFATLLATESQSPPTGSSGQNVYATAASRLPKLDRPTLAGAPPADRQIWPVVVMVVAVVLSALGGFALWRYILAPSPKAGYAQATDRPAIVRVER